MSGFLKKILVLDDEADIVAFLANFLKRKRIKVFQTTSFDRGLELFGQEKPDLILLDINMPGLDGFEFLRHIRKNDNKVKIVMVTGNEDKGSMNKALKLGADGYVTKPLELKELYRIVSGYLKIKKER